MSIWLRVIATVLIMIDIVIAMIDIEKLLKGEDEFVDMDYKLILAVVSFMLIGLSYSLGGK